VGSVILALGLLPSGAGADTSLGGFTLNSVAEGISLQYEQPDLPLPVTPSLQFDAGYASSTDNAGPTGIGLASVLYPGPLIASAGPELSLLFPGVPLPPAPEWPIQATSSFPQTPNTASSDESGVTMESNASANAITATAALGNANATTAGTGGGPLPLGLPALPSVGSLLGVGSAATGTNSNPLAVSTPFLAVQGISATATSGAPAASAMAGGTAIDTGVSLLGGFIYIGSISTTATASSDGNTATLTGSTTLADVYIAGEAVTIDASGIHASGENSPAIPIATLAGLLKSAGISLTVTSPVNSTNGATGTSELDGLKLVINLTQFDKDGAPLEKLIPSSVVAQLPFGFPQEQILTLELGTVSVATAASPAFVAGDTGGSQSGDTGESSSVNAFPAASSDLGSGLSSGGTGSGKGGHPLSSSPTSAVLPVFKGVGAGLVLLGLLGGALLMIASTASLGPADGLVAGAGGGAGDPLGPDGGGGSDADLWDSSLSLEPEGPPGPGGGI
jgi:hypothetical protein